MLEVSGTDDLRIENADINKIGNPDANRDIQSAPTPVSLRHGRLEISNAVDSLARKAFGGISRHKRFAMGTKRRLFNRSFLALMGTQFLGAANDNVLKQVLVFMIATGIWSGSLAEGGLGEGGQSVPALFLTLPFIFLSGFAGQLADRYSKRSVMLAVKIAEVPIAVIALVGLCTQSLWITLGAMLLLSIQSSFFGPAKYGVLPEIVDDQALSQANGLLNMSTNVAIILGSLAAGPLCALYDPDPASGVAPLLWAPGITLVVVAVLGLLSIVAMPQMPGANPALKLKFDVFATYRESIRDMGPVLLTVALAWSGFYMIGMIALLILPEYENILPIGYVGTSLLLGLMGVSIAVSSVAAGFISGRSIKPHLIPMGATGMAVSFLLLGVLEPTVTVVAVLVGLAGLSAGFYIVPLQALIQKLSPDDERGRFLGTASAMSFTASSLGAGLFWLFSGPLAVAPNRIFFVCGTLAVAGTIVGTVQLKKLLAAQAQAAPEPQPAD